MSEAAAADLPFASDEERIIEVVAGQHHFEEPLLCYLQSDMLFVPLGQLAQMIDLAVKSYPITGQAQGFIFDENTTFMLDVGQRLVVVGGVAKRLNPEQIRVASDDIYVDAALLGEWFPFVLEPSLLNSRMVIRSRRPLPFEERITLERRAKQLARSGARLPAYPQRDEPYLWWETPFIDQTLRAGTARDSVGNHSSTYAYTTYATGDLMKMESSWYLAGSQVESPDTLRMTLSRRDPQGRVLGPVGLTELSLGHVLEPRVALVNLPVTLEPGILFGNAPLTRSSTFDTHTFVGDLKPGWSVELYHNNALLGYQLPNSEGQYRFNDIPLLYGSNNFRLLFYGPQGQRHEENQYFEIGQSLTPVGRHHYRVMASQGALGSSRSVVEYNAGLLPNLSLSSNAVSLALAEADGSVRQHNYLRAGLNTLWSRALLSVGMIDDAAGGSAAELRLQGRIESAVVGMSHIRFNDFVSEEFAVGQLPIESRTQMRLDTALPSTAWSPMLPMSLELNRDLYRNEVENRRVDLRLSMLQHGLSLANQLSWSHYTAMPVSSNGVLQASLHYGDLGIRADYHYTLAPAMGSSAIALSTILTNYHRYNLSAGITYSATPKRVYASAGISRDFGQLLGSASLRYGSQGDYWLEMGLSFSLGRNPRSSEWLMQSRPLAYYGAVAPQLFLDENGNGLRDEGESPLPEVGLKLNGISRPPRSDAQGNALVTGLVPYQPVAVSIDESSLADPAYQPRLQGVTLLSRPGHVTQLDLPIQMTGELDGTVALRREGHRIAVGGVELQLVAADGTIVQRTRSAYDGYYLFSKVATGRYQIRIDPQQTQRLGLREPDARAVSVDASQWSSSGNDILLERQEQ